MGTIAILKLKSGKIAYRAEVRREGVRRTKSFARKTDANAWITDQESAIHKGLIAPQIKRYTLGEAIDRYFLEVLPLKKPVTQSLHRNQLEWFKARIGQVKLMHLTSDVLVRAREALRTEDVQRKYTKKKFRRAPGTINRYFVPLLHCLKKACDDWGWIQAIPRMSKLREPKGRTRYFTPEEAHRILDYFEKDPRRDVRLAIRISMTMGSRLLETCALTWREINFQRRFIVFTTTKTDDVKGVPIPDGLFAELEKWRELSQSDYLFPTGRKSKRPYVYHKVSHAFKKALLHLGITDASFHNTRHTVGSWATQDGVNRRKVAEVLGHKELSTTDRYSHLDVEHLRPVVDAIEEKLLKRASVS